MAERAAAGYLAAHRGPRSPMAHRLVLEGHQYTLVQLDLTPRRRERERPPPAAVTKSQSNSFRAL